MYAPLNSGHVLKVMRQHRLNKTACTQVGKCGCLQAYTKISTYFTESSKSCGETIAQFVSDRESEGHFATFILCV